jgi:DNA adenine methylase
MAANQTKAKPVLKWAGGKRRLLPQILAHMSPAMVKVSHIKTYVEPFFGGGAMFFHLVERFSFGRVVINDFNADLTLVYRVIQSGHIDALVGVLSGYRDRYIPLEHEQRAEVFYGVRSEYNRMRPHVDLVGDIGPAHIERAAMTIFLNKTCFNGLYRVNSRGDYNVPHGRYIRPDICNKGVLMAAHRVLQGAEIRTGSYENVDDAIDEDAFVYLDPPYRPLPGAASFTDYIQKATFGDADQEVLGNWFTTWHERGAALMLSNSDPKATDPADDFFDDLYEAFDIHRIQASRAINSDGEGRGPITEILVTNSPIKGGEK